MLPSPSLITNSALANGAFVSLSTFINSMEPTSVPPPPEDIVDILTLEFSVNGSGSPPFPGSAIIPSKYTSFFNHS